MGQNFLPKKKQNVRSKIRFLSFRDFYKRIGNTIYLANKATDTYRIDDLTEEEMKQIETFYVESLSTVIDDILKFLKRDYVECRNEVMSNFARDLASVPENSQDTHIEQQVKDGGSKYVSKCGHCRVGDLEFVEFDPVKFTELYRCNRCGLSEHHRVYRHITALPEEDNVTSTKYGN